ncbi:MAG TPA: signal peptide peptidase SppA, partial [Polyangiaceae bacterium]|nr:signal peptide peptidase SppA [Polyangiaceae bacterium]
EVNGGIAADRKQSLAKLRSTVEKGPFTAAEAKVAGLVDGFAFDDMLEEKVSDLAHDDLAFEKPTRAKGKSERFGPTKRIAIVYVEGDMVDGRSSSIPFLNIHTAGSYTIAESLKHVREDPSVGAVVLRIETGGGSAMAADIIWREVQLTREKKPVVVSMGSAAASGGYYIASPGTYIFANPLSVTGSIGIFFGKVDVAGLLSRFGINVETLRTTKHADAETPFRPFLDEEREVLKRKIEQYYSLFLQRVATGRGMTRAQVDAVGRGRVWTGRQAREHKLVDELGGLRQAMTKARELARMRDDAPVIELPKRQQSLLGKLLGVDGLRTQLAEGTPRPQLPKELLRAAHAIVPYTLYADDQPLARIEVLPQWLP